MDSFNKSRSNHIYSCFIMSCILLIVLTGCDNPEKLHKIQDSIKQTAAAQTESTQEVSKQAVPSQLTSDIYEEENEEQSKIDIKNFKPFQQCFINYDFSVKLNGTEAKPISFLVEGKYDLNHDGTQDHITILTRGNYGREKEVQTYIEVNEVRQDFYMDYTEDGEVRVIDLDENDKFIEVAIFDEGPSGDPHYIFYRFDGEKLYEIGGMDSGALINGEGKLLSEFNISCFTPRFYSAWYEIIDNAFLQRPNDIKSYLGRNYKFDGGEAYFIPTKEMPKDFMATWGETKQFKATDVKIIDVYFSSSEDRVLNYYFVEFSNGEKGMLYFWIGD